jgi:hypothetical protein
VAAKLRICPALARHPAEMPIPSPKNEIALIDSTQR